MRKLALIGLVKMKVLATTLLMMLEAMILKTRTAALGHVISKDRILNA